MPHSVVVISDRDIIKDRDIINVLVFDDTPKHKGRTSPNDCLTPGPNLNHRNLDSMLQF